MKKTKLPFTALCLMVSAGILAYFFSGNYIFAEETRASLSNVSAVETNTTVETDAAPTSEVKATLDSSSISGDSGGSASLTNSTEPIVQVSDSIEKVRESVSTAEKEVTTIFEQSISNSIRQAVQSPSGVTDIPSLNRVVDVPRVKTLNSLGAALQDAGNDIVSKKGDRAINDADKKTQAIKNLVDKGIKDVEESVRAISPDLEVNNSAERERINAILDAFLSHIKEYKEDLDAADADLLYKDSDKDGLSDYDEIYLYHTNPNKAVTTPVEVSEEGQGKAASSTSDGEKILQGINPLSERGEQRRFQDPRVIEVATSSVLVVEEIKTAEIVYATSTASSTDSLGTASGTVELVTKPKPIEISGRALPNSYVTIYIFSTPIVVTIKADAEGQWKYVLDKELENGSHTLYAATIDNSGKIVAKTAPFRFIKTAEAVSFDESPVIRVNEVVRPSLLNGGYNTIMVVLLVIFGLLSLVFIGFFTKHPLAEPIGSSGSGAGTPNSPQPPSSDSPQGTTRTDKK